MRDFSGDLSVKFFDKRGASDWTIGKLITIVLMVFVLVLLSYGIANGMMPSIETIEGEFDRIADTLKFWASGEDEVCYSQPVSGFVGGDGLLKEFGLEGRDDVLLGRCRDECNVSGGGLGPYRVKGGVFERGVGEKWEGVDNLIVGDVKEAEFHWGLYHGVVELFGGTKGVFDENGNWVEDAGSSIEHGSTRKFVLYGDGAGAGEDIVAIWQNGAWEIRRGPIRSGSGFNAKSGKMFSEEDGREIVWEGSDDDEALEFFYDVVDSANDDRVYWKILDADEKYDYLKDKGEIIGLFFGSVVNNKYDSLQAAEHGVDNLNNPKYDPWIRTRAAGTGSTAYGPVQLTKGLAEGYLTNGVINWTSEERDYLERFVDQGWRFLAHGGQEGKGVVDENQTRKHLEKYNLGLGIFIGDPYEAKYDYSDKSDKSKGIGDLTSLEDKKMYRQVAIKMIEEIYQRNDKGMNALCREWRFGPSGNLINDLPYYFRFVSVWNGNDDSDEVDSDEKFDLLRSAFYNKKYELLEEVKISSEEFDRIKEVVDGKVVVVDGESFNVNTYMFSDNIVIVLESEKGEKFGLRYSPYDDFNSGSNLLFDRMSFVDIPFVLVEGKGDSTSVLSEFNYNCDEHIVLNDEHVEIPNGKTYCINSKGSAGLGYLQNYVSGNSFGISFEGDGKLIIENGAEITGGDFGVKMSQGEIHILSGAKVLDGFFGSGMTGGKIHIYKDALFGAELGGGREGGEVYVERGAIINNGHGSKPLALISGGVSGLTYVYKGAIFGGKEINSIQELMDAKFTTSTDYNSFKTGSHGGSLATEWYFVSDNFRKRDDQFVSSKDSCPSDTGCVIFTEGAESSMGSDEGAGGYWVEVGNKNHYRLSEEKFKEVRRMTLVSRFLRSVCL